MRAITRLAALVIMAIAFVVSTSEVEARRVPSRHQRLPNYRFGQSQNPLANALLDYFSPNDAPFSGYYGANMEGMAAGIQDWYLYGQFGQPVMRSMTGPYPVYSNDGGVWRNGYWGGYAIRSPYDWAIREGVLAGMGANYTPLYWPYAHGSFEDYWYRWGWQLGTTRELQRFEYSKEGSSANPPPLDDLPPAAGAITEESPGFRFPEE